MLDAEEVIVIVELLVCALDEGILELVLLVKWVVVLLVGFLELVLLVCALVVGMLEVVLFEA